MGVYIKGMKMPDTCWDCFLFSGNCCKATGSVVAYWTNNLTEKPSDCPLVEVKSPHGRLGDLDALESEGADLCCDNGYYGSTEWGFSYEMIDNAPTIIEAEGKDDD